jgi:hypothetical protein
MNQQPRTLDISELQVVVEFPNDANVTWHHRVLLHRVTDATWITLTPDLELERLNLAARRHRVLERAARFPADVEEDLYYFDPLEKGVLIRNKRLAKTQAVVLGAGGEEELHALQWVYYEPSEPHFGKPVEEDLIDHAEHFVSLGDQGLVIRDGKVQRIAKVAGDPLEQWLADRKKEEDDIRLLGHHTDQTGARFLSWQDAVGMFRETPMPEWKFDGPRVTKELSEAVRDGSGNPTSYHAEWVRLSGVNQHSAVAYEHRHCMEVLRLATHQDQLDISNIAAFEQIARRVVQLEIAADKDPHNPDFTGLGVVSDGAVDSRGSARAPKFKQWVSQKQQQQAQILKQQRLYKEEALAERKARKGRGKGKDKDGKGVKKTKVAEAGDGPAADN